MNLKEPWKKFDHTNFECGLFWISYREPVFDVDTDDYGKAVGTPTGQEKVKVALARVEDDSDHHTEAVLPAFYIGVEEGFEGRRLSEECIVVAYAELVAPEFEITPNNQPENN